MFKHIFLILIGLTLWSCVGPEKSYNITNPSEFSDGGLNAPKSVSVLVPNNDIGLQIRNAITMAALESQSENITFNFTDTVNDNTDMIIGPIFAKDTAIIRDSRTHNIPVISFSSDASALGNGVYSISLFPNNGTEEVVRDISNQKFERIVILTPDTKSGYLMANTALNAANNFDIDVLGLYYYTENDTDSIKNVAMNASNFNARENANINAKRILSDVLVNEKLTAYWRSNINAQLEKISKSDTLGNVPYDAILFLGNVNDSRALASFLRYYDVDGRKIKLFGTPLWDGTDIANDINMTGARFSALPKTNERFANNWMAMTNEMPSRIASFGYDSARMTIGALSSPLGKHEYLTSPSGFVGNDGIIRFMEDGANERALEIREIKNSEIITVNDAAKNFITPLYNTRPVNSKPDEIKLNNTNINVYDYIRIPDELKGKYKSQRSTVNSQRSTESQILPQDDTVIIDDEFTGTNREDVDVRLID